jgi:hypothetical protein
MANATSLRAGADRTEITPPLTVGILMSSVEQRWAPFEGVRTPLYARCVVLEQGGRRVALVSLELLGLSDRAVGGYAAFKARVAAAAGHGFMANDVILTSTHTHSSPSSLGLTDLYRTPQFQNWLDTLVQQIGRAIEQALIRAVPCRLAVGLTEVAGLAIHRRIHTVDGIVLSHPPPPPEKVLSRAGAIDPGVRVGAFLDTHDRPVALIVNATCHPVYEMCIPQVSGDYPGEMSAALEQEHPGAVALFLNGAAGNINPPTVSSGAEEAGRHGRRLAAAVEGLLAQLRPVEEPALALARGSVDIAARTVTGEAAAAPLHVELAALRVGDARFLFIPGEPFVETGLAVYAASPDRFTVVAGYAEDWIGYIPTDEALAEGGYETGPGAWSRVGPGGEERVRHAALDLLRALDSHAAG